MVHCLEDGLIYPSRYFEQLHPNNTDTISRVRDNYSDSIYISTSLEYLGDDDIIIEVNQDIVKKIIGSDILSGFYPVVLPMGCIKQIYCHDNNILEKLRNLITPSDIPSKNGVLEKITLNTSANRKDDYPQLRSRIRPKMKTDIQRFMNLFGALSFIQNTECNMEDLDRDIISSLDPTFRKILESYSKIEFPEEFIGEISSDKSQIPSVIENVIFPNKDIMNKDHYVDQIPAFSILKDYFDREDDFHEVFSDCISELFNNTPSVEGRHMEFLNDYNLYDNDDLSLDELVKKYEINIDDHLPIFIALHIKKYSSRSRLREDSQAFRNLIFLSKLGYVPTQVALFFGGYYYKYHNIRISDNVHTTIKSKKRPLKINPFNQMTGVLYNTLFNIDSC